jgi:uncharacterized protein YbaP (TraB family)
MSRKLKAWIGGLLLSVSAGVAAADCGLPPAGDDALLAAPGPAAAIVEARREIPNAEGRVWRVATDPPSYLVGTFHFKAGGIEEPGPTLDRIVDDADTLFVEVDRAALEATVQRWAADPAALFRSDGSRLTDGMTEAEIERAEALLEGYGLPLAMADQMQPVILFALLSLPACALEEASGDGLDAVLEARASASGADVRALETVEEQLAALSGPDLDEALRLLVAQADQMKEQWFLNLAFYREGKIAALWLYGIEQFAAEVGEAEAERVAAAFWERLVGSRNRRMVERMLPRLREGGTVVAVGALHLPGDDGIIELLRAEGFAIERVAERVYGAGAPPPPTMEGVPAD